jgi:hypothetical protein
MHIAPRNMHIAPVFILQPAYENCYAMFFGGDHGFKDGAESMIVGTLENGYVRNTPLPRIPRRQSTSRVAHATN